MNGDWSHEQGSEDSSDTPKYIGGAFMAAGVVLAGWVVNVIYHLITGEGPTDIVSSLIPREAMDVFIQTPGGPMEIPPFLVLCFWLDGDGDAVVDLCGVGENVHYDRDEIFSAEFG